LDKLDSSERWVDSFDGGLDSVAAYVNHDAVSSNWKRVMALGNMRGRGGKRERGKTCVTFWSLIGCSGTSMNSRFAFMYHGTNSSYLYPKN
jgi:hypothetical protein